MQMPGGRHDVSYDRLSIDDRQGREHGKRKRSRTTQQQPQRDANGGAQLAVVATECSVSPTLYANKSADNIDTDGFNSQAFGQNDDTESVASNNHDRSRSRIARVFDAVSKPFIRGRSKSVGHRTPTSTRRSQSSAPSTPDLTLDDQSIPRSQSAMAEAGSDGMVIQFPGGRIPGIVGIRNHGNTCFMNAVLQCLSNTEHFSEFFVTDECRPHILAAQRAGRMCAVTEQLAQLFASLWTCEYTPDRSLQFKTTVGRCANQYSGSDQNDAQEFLQWLLDRVHEELYGPSIANGKSSKTKTEAKSNGVPAENHENGNAAADSPDLGIVYDLFRAQFRSTLTCPSCGKQSHKLDPFLLVPLPIPEKYKIPVYPTVIRYNTAANPTKVGVLMSTAEMVSDLRRYVAARAEVPTKQLLLLQIANDFGFMRTFNDGELMSELESQLEAVYAVQAGPADDGQNIILVCLNIATSENDAKRIGNPFAVCVQRDSSSRVLRNILVSSMRWMFKDSSLTQMETVSQLFNLRIVREQFPDIFLQDDVELPLYTTDVDDALSCCRAGDGPPHIKLVLDWDAAVYKRWMSRNGLHPATSEDQSVKQVKSENQHSSSASLDDLFSVFTQQERLGASDKWYCPSCRHHQTGTIKTLSLSTLPDVMVVQLKRFKQETEHRTKLNALIRFPVIGLDMSRHMEKPANVNNNDYSRWKEDCVYDLYAVCNHFGDMQSGHYTAFCKNPVSDQWYRFDDAKVYKLHQDAIVTKSAYLLFYRRRLSQTRCETTMQQWITAVCGATFAKVDERPVEVQRKTVASLSVSNNNDRSHDRSVTAHDRSFARQTYTTSSARPSSRSAYPAGLSQSQQQYALQRNAMFLTARGAPPAVIFNVLSRPPRHSKPIPDPWLTVAPSRSRPRTTSETLDPLPAHAYRRWQGNGVRPYKGPVPAADRMISNGSPPVSEQIKPTGAVLSVDARPPETSNDSSSSSRSLVKSNTDSNIGSLLLDFIPEPKRTSATSVVSLPQPSIASAVTVPPIQQSRKMVFEKVYTPAPQPKSIADTRRTLPLQESSV